MGALPCVGMRLRQYLRFSVSQRRVYFGVLGGKDVPVNVAGGL